MINQDKWNRQGERRDVYRVLVGRHEGKNYLEDLDINRSHWASYSIGTRSSYHSSKADGAWSQPLTIYWQVKTGWSYTSTILYASMACTEINFIPTEGMCETYICLSLFHILHQKWGCMDYMTQEVTKCVFLICLEAFMVTNLNKILSGRQPHQSVKIFQKAWLSAQDFNKSMFYLTII